MRKIVTSHLTGNANVKAALYGFLQFNILAKFHVTIASTPGSLVDKLATIPMFSEIRRRSFKPELRPFIKSWPLLEIGRILSSKFKLRGHLQSGAPVFFMFLSGTKP